MLRTMVVVSGEYQSGKASAADLCGIHNCSSATFPPKPSTASIQGGSLEHEEFSGRFGDVRRSIHKTFRTMDDEPPGFSGIDGAASSSATASSRPFFLYSENFEW